MIREALLGGRGEVIKNPKVFMDPLAFFKDIPFREDILREVAISIRYFVKNNVKFSTLFLGLTGTGKTLVAKYILNEIEEIKPEDPSYAELTQAYVNCREVGGTPQAVLSALTEKLTGKPVPKHGINLGEYVEAIKEGLGKKKAIVYLDEVDTLVKRRGGDIVLYQLLRTDADISTIMISNDINVRDYMEPRIVSSLGPTIIFKPYDAEQLMKILEMYSDIGLYKGTYDSEVLAYIAAISAKEHGDARKAVNLLFRAAQLASGTGRITKAHVDRAIIEYEQEKLLEAVKALPFHYKLALMAVIEAEDLMSAHKVYSDLCVKYGLINRGLAGGIRKYVEVPDREKVKKVLEENMLLGVE